MTLNKHRCFSINRITALFADAEMPDEFFIQFLSSIDFIGNAYCQTCVKRYYFRDHWRILVCFLKITESSAASYQTLLEISTLLLCLRPCNRRWWWRWLWPRRSLVYSRRGRFLLRRLENRDHCVGLHINDVAFRSSAYVCPRLVMRYVWPLGLLRTFSTI